MEYTIEIFKEVNVVSYYQTERTVQRENTHKSIKASMMTVTIAEDMALQSEQPEICEKYWIVRTALFTHGLALRSFSSLRALFYKV